MQGITSDVPMLGEFQQLSFRKLHQGIHLCLAPLKVLNRESEHGDTLYSQSQTYFQHLHGGTGAGWVKRTNELEVTRTCRRA